MSSENSRDATCALQGPLLHRILACLGWSDLASAALVNKAWSDCASCSRLWEHLDLSGHQGAGGCMLRAARSPQFKRHLKSIKLEFAADVEDAHLLSLPTANLQSLNLNGCQKLSEGAILNIISATSQLEALELYWVLSVTDATLMAVSAFATSLKRLSLSGCKRVTDQGLRLLAGTCHQLQYLNLTRCVQLSSKGVVTITRHCAELRELHLYACPQMTDECLNGIGELRHLRLISLCGAVQLTDEGLTRLANCSELDWVDLSWCIGLTDRGVCQLAKGCPRLVLLSLHGLRSITDASIDALAAHCAAALQTIDVNGCVGINASSQAELVDKLPRLTRFIVHT